VLSQDGNEVTHREAESSLEYYARDRGVRIKARLSAVAAAGTVTHLEQPASTG